MPDTSYGPKVYMKQGGDELVVASGGKITIESGGVIDGVTFANTKMFVSAEQTGTGSAQSIAHGLGVAPAAVLIVPTDTSPATVGAYTAVEGTHTSTNVLATVTTGKKYKVWAMA
jgi:hypothetical protein